MTDEAPEAGLEVLNDAHQALLRNSFDTSPQAYIRASNRLLDACIDAGMSYHEPDHEAWAANRVTQWMVSA